MNKTIINYLSVCFCILFVACNSGKTTDTAAKIADTNKTLNSNALLMTNADSTIVDTVYANVDIDGSMYTITVYKDKYDEDHELRSESEDGLRYSPTRFVITKKADGTVVFNQKFTENQYQLFKKDTLGFNLPGKLYLSLITEAVGSGYGATLYRVNMGVSGKIELIKAFEYGELSCFAINKDDNGFLKLTGDWNFDEHETHFEQHRYQVSKYDWKDGKYMETKIGKTKEKYVSTADAPSVKELLQEIYTNEPQLMQGIQTDNYLYIQ